MAVLKRMLGIEPRLVICMASTLPAVLRLRTLFSPPSPSSPSGHRPLLTPFFPLVTPLSLQLYETMSAYAWPRAWYHPTRHSLGTDKCWAWAIPIPQSTSTAAEDAYEFGDVAGCEPGCSP